MSIRKGNSKFFFYLIGMLLLAAFLIPSNTMKNTEIFECAKCGSIKTFVNYSCSFWILIPDIKHRIKETSKSQDGHKHTWKGPISIDMSGRGLLANNYRYLIVFLVFFMLFHRFVYIRFIKDYITITNIAMLFRVVRLLGVTLIFVAILLSGLFFLKFKANSKNKFISLFDVYDMFGDKLEQFKDNKLAKKVISNFKANTKFSNKTTINYRG